MPTSARPPAPGHRKAALMTLAALVLVAIPMTVRAAHCGGAPGILFAGHHQPLAHVTHLVRASAHLPHGHAAWRHAPVDCHGAVRNADGFRWSLHDGQTRSACGASDVEIREVIEALGDGASFLWFSQDGEPRVVRDRALVARAHASIEPMQRLGKEMGRLGGEMGRIGARQGLIGAEMGRLGARQGVLAARLALLELRDDDDPAIERQADAIERQMDELSRRQGEFGRRHESSAGARMDDLGEQMDRLGRRMEQASRRAERELRALAKEAIAAGKAERVGDRGDL